MRTIAAAAAAGLLSAGVDSIEHGTLIDDETVRLFKARGAYPVPTMIAPVTALEQARGGRQGRVRH